MRRVESSIAAEAVTDDVLEALPDWLDERLAEYAEVLTYLHDH